MSDSDTGFASLPESLLKGDSFLSKKNQDEIVASLQDYKESIGELAQLGEKIAHLSTSNKDNIIVMNPKRV